MVAQTDPQPLTAAHFAQRLDELKSGAERDKYRRYFSFGPDEEFIGVRMGQVFGLAKEFIDLPPGEVEILLASPIHEIRAGACSIMGKSAGHAKASSERREELYELYLRRHDRINNWDLVDLAAANVVGTTFGPDRGTRSTNLRAKTSGRNAVPPSSRRPGSSAGTTWTTPSRSPRCC